MVRSSPRALMLCAAALFLGGDALAQQSLCSTDADGDGYYSDAGCPGLTDCNDADATIHPLATEIFCDGVDQDCYGGDICGEGGGCDADGDGFVSHTCGGDDCNDGDPLTHPGADDLEGNGLDEDCDGYDYCQVEWVQGGLGCATGPGGAPALALLIAGAALVFGRRHE